MNKLIYLIEDFNEAVKEIVNDKDFEDCGLTEENVVKALTSFGGDKIATSVFLKKYAVNNGEKIIEFTLDEAKDRWANAIMEAEEKFSIRKNVKYFRELYDYMLPGGRQMFALGNNYIKKATFSNCYVTKIEEDSIEGIYDAAKRCARTYSFGGGIGLCVGELRPADAKVSNSAKHSTGAVSFMDLFSMTTGLIGQNSRRGALLLSIPIDHPDIYKFIEVKHLNKDKIKHANISIKITDDFMRAVENDSDFILSFKTKHEVIEKVVKARDLWDKIITSACDSGEPGILFWSKAVEMSPSDNYKRLKIHTTNPCLTGDTLVYVADGRGNIPIKQLAKEDKDVPVFCFDDNNKITIRYMRHPRITGQNVGVYKITLDDGLIIKATENHKFKLKNGEYEEVRNLKKNDSLQIITKFEASIKDLKECACKYNHKIVNIEFYGYEDVYNGTVDEFHNYFVGGFEKENINGKKEWVYVNSKNCGEILLSAGDSCCLSSLLLHKFVENPFTENALFNYKLFSEMASRGVRHLDNVVELNFGRHPLEEQEEASHLGRRIGLGITGLADMFASMGIKYDSEKALEVVNSVMETKKLAEYEASTDLAKERGSFPLYNPDIHFTRSFTATLPDWLIDKAKKDGLRNVSISTVAPSGSISIIAQCSSGIEPIYALHYMRNVMLGKAEKKTFSVHHPGVLRFFAATNSTTLPDYWVAAHDVNYKNRIKLQGIVQKNVDSSLSSTVNLPKETSKEVVSEIYFNAWKEGLKGITVYREGSREGVLITDEYAEAAGIPNMNTSVHCVRAEGGDKFYIMVSYENKDITKPYQVFVMNYKKADSDAFVKIGNSLIKMLREKNAPEERITKYIERSGSSLVKMTRFLSLSMKTDNLSNALKILDEHAFVGTLAEKLYEILSKSVGAIKLTCPNCGGDNLKMEESCVSCLNCFWSRCH